MRKQSVSSKEPPRVVRLVAVEVYRADGSQRVSKGAGGAAFGVATCAGWKHYACVLETEDGQRWQARLGGFKPPTFEMVEELLTRQPTAFSKPQA